MAALSRRASFVVVAGVLSLSLWASGSPAMVYPLYVERWGATPLDTTALFSTYPVALVFALTITGSLSDVRGRRPVLLFGMGIVALGTLVFIVADALPWLFAGRALQGVGVGITLSAAAAALTDYDTTSRPARVSAVNTAATSAGAATAIILGGALVQYSSAPERAPFIALLVAALALLGLLLFLPANAHTGGRWHPARPRIPITNRVSFLLGTGTIMSAFVMGGVFLALGAQIAKDLVGSQNAFTASLSLASWPLAGIPASLMANRISTRASSLIGGVTAAVGSLLLLPAADTHLLALFLAASVLSGFGYGLLFSSGFSLVSSASRPSARAGSLSTMYLTVYLAQASGAVAIGAIATTVGLATALILAMPVIAALCLLATITGWKRPQQ